MSEKSPRVLSQADLRQAMGTGVVDNFDPGLRRAFDFADNTIPLELRDPEKLKMKPDHLKLSGDGIFYTLQGEGPTMGEPTSFLRLQICNLACGWCFPKGNKVLTVDGEKDISEIKEGDMVYSYKDKRVTASRVNKVLTRESDYLVKIIPSEGKETIVTADHKFYVNKRKSKSGKNWQLPASKLQGKYIKSFQGFFKKQELSDTTKLGYLKGAYIGDGYSNGIDRLQFAVLDYEFIEVLQKLVNDLGANCSILNEKRLTVTGNQVYRISTSKKDIIKKVLEPVESYEEWRGFIAGFFDAEGHLGRNNLSMSQKDIKLLERIKGILEDTVEIICSDIKEGTRSFYIQINGKRNIKRFYEKFPIQISRKIYSDERRILDDVLVDKVEDYISTEIVYNLETTIGNYFINGFLVGNCDAWYTWNPKTPEFWTEGRDVPTGEVAELVRDNWGAKDERIQRRLVITGGEPLIQKGEIDNLMDKLPEYKFEIETNGTIMPTEKQLAEAQFNCSPKLRNSANMERSRKRPDVIHALAEANTTFKFVVMTNEDLDEIENEWVNGVGIDPEKVILMPQGVTAEEVQQNMRVVAEHAKLKGYRMLGRLQNDIWGARRGV